MEFHHVLYVISGFIIARTITVVTILIKKWIHHEDQLQASASGLGRKHRKDIDATGPSVSKRFDDLLEGR